MQLLIDVGNTRAKFCRYKEKQFGQLRYCDNKSLTRIWLLEHWNNIDDIVIASVAKSDVVDIIRQWCLECHINFTEVTSEKVAYGITNGYQNPKQLGVDRWLALLGARQLFPSKACLIVDTGTATTVDYINELGKHSGGWILAGINTLVESIQQNTAHVAGQEYQINQPTFGNNTADNLSQAAWAATLGLVSQAKHVISADDQQIEKIIITGGNGGELARLLKEPVELIPMLVFYGLRCYTIN